jgi:uncharacterized damage-inducible protein DinB
MNSFFQELFDYSHHYNQMLAEEFQKNGDRIPEKSIKLFSHLLNAHHIWNSRINGHISAYTIWQVHTSDHFLWMDLDNYENTKKILEIKSLEEKITYVNSQGNQFTNTIRDILFHVVNHSTYHRAQIASDLKQSGIEPLITDYIFYKR